MAKLLSNERTRLKTGSFKCNRLNCKSKRSKSNEKLKNNQLRIKYKEDMRSSVSISPLRRQKKKLLQSQEMQYEQKLKTDVITKLTKSNMQKPLISLLMPAYNTVRFIKSAIDSIKKQTYDNWELVIVDDCSDDGTWELVSKLSESDSRIKTYRNELNLGIVKNRKRAYEFSSGEFVCHFDNDDMLERYALEEMMNAFEQMPAVMLIYSDIAQIGEHGEHQLYSASINFDPNKLYQHGWRHLGMYRREVMQHIDGYNEKLISGCEDGDLFMQIAEKFPCARLPKALYFYRSHGENKSGQNKKCESCSERPVCNFVRVWCRSVNYDPITFKPFEVPDE